MNKVQTPPDPISIRPFTLEHVEVQPMHRDVMQAYPADTPAHISWENNRAIVTHREFFAELDPFSGTGEFCRTICSSAALEICLKVAMCCILPVIGGVPLHAASIVLSGSAAIFFGPSGAGKSTIAGAADAPVLSDELVAVHEDGSFGVRATGFWGTLNRETAPLERFPVGGLFELRKEPKLRLDRVAPHDVMRRLLKVVIVPPAPPLWSRVATVLSRLADAVPGYELGWAKDHPPLLEVQAACHAGSLQSLV
jgi:hypothetical protein